MKCLGGKGPRKGGRQQEQKATALLTAKNRLRIIIILMFGLGVKPGSRDSRLQRVLIRQQVKQSPPTDNKQIIPIPRRRPICPQKE
jgi:hypothetical protein